MTLEHARESTATTPKIQNIAVFSQWLGRNHRNRGVKVNTVADEVPFTAQPAHILHQRHRREGSYILAQRYILEDPSLVQPDPLFYRKAAAKLEIRVQCVSLYDLLGSGFQSSNIEQALFKPP